MRNWWNRHPRRLARDSRGVAPVAFVLALPLLVLVAVGMIDAGRVINQATVVQKGLRAGALYAARNDFPLSAAVLTQVENIVKTGDPAGASSYLVSGWAKAGASLQVQTLAFDHF